MNQSLILRNIKPKADATIRCIILGEDVAKGQVLSLRIDRLHYLAQCDLTLTESAARAIALESGTKGDSILAIHAGLFDPGCKLDTLATYAVGDMPGTIVPTQLLQRGHMLTHLFTAYYPRIANLNIRAEGIPLPSLKEADDG